jgi:hypothetical protein
MKVSAFLIIILALFIGDGCEKPNNKTVDGYKVLSGAGGTISFVDSIGADFSTALDSLIIQ